MARNQVCTANEPPAIDSAAMVLPVTLHDDESSPGLPMGLADSIGTVTC